MSSPPRVKRGHDPGPGTPSTATGHPSRDQPLSKEVPHETSPSRPARSGLGRSWFWLASVAALLAAIGSVGGLSAPGAVYGRETQILADQAAAQDLVNLLLVAPVTVVLGRLARRGSLRAHVVWAGCVAFTVYNYAIYAFSIHFGPLFLVWVAVLGLTVFALIGGVATAIQREGGAQLTGRARWPGWFLIVVATLFALLWLREIMPDLIAGRPSRSASEWHVPTNPVHVLDLAFFLPAAVAGGVLLLRHHPFGYLAASAQLTWVALTSVPILVTPLVAEARGHEAVWAVAAPIGIILLLSAAALVRLIASPQPQGPMAVQSRDGDTDAC